MSASIRFTGNTTSGSPTVASVSSTAALRVGMVVAGAGIPGATTIASIGSGTITLSANATATATAVALTETLTGFVNLVATAIQNAAGGLLAAGTLEVLPTDGNDKPIAAAAGGAGGQLLCGPSSSPSGAVFAVTNGALPANAFIADTTLTLPPNISYRMTVKDANGTRVSVLRFVQTVADTTLNLDTYQPVMSAAQAIAVVGPTGPPGPIGGVTGASSIILIDTVTSQQIELTFADGVPVYTIL